MTITREDLTVLSQLITKEIKREMSSLKIQKGGRGRPTIVNQAPKIKITNTKPYKLKINYTKVLFKKANEERDSSEIISSAVQRALQKFYEKIGNATVKEQITKG